MSQTSEINTEILIKRSEGRFEIKLTGLPKDGEYLAHALLSIYELIGVLARNSYPHAKRMPTQAIIEDMQREGVRVGINFTAASPTREFFRGEKGAD